MTSFVSSSATPTSSSRTIPPRNCAAWGLSYADLSAINSALVMVSVSCYGNTGPLAGRPGAGTLAEAFGGLTYMTGEASARRCCRRSRSATR